MKEMVINFENVVMLMSVMLQRYKYSHYETVSNHSNINIAITN